jgi:hypothetical protein
MELENKNIALGSTPADFRDRKKFIMDFYAQWIVENPERHIFNKFLNSFIEVRYLSMNETSGHASLSHKSTLAVTYLTEILENAIDKGKTLEPKKDNKKQKRFSKIHIMEYEKADFGKIKLTVGELRGSGQKIQYCVTAIE